MQTPSDKSWNAAARNAIGELLNPPLRIATSTTRAWNDRGGLGTDGDYVPQCDLLNPAANGGTYPNL